MVIVEGVAPVAAPLPAELVERAGDRPRPNDHARSHDGAIRERDPNETASPVGKGDINEEIVRLKAHVAELAKVTREREPVGKKIDFMLQEVNRELNTISSKVPNLPVIQLVLRGKERVEKIREQTQNIE